MKDKFEKLESGIASAFMVIAKYLPIDIALQLDKLRERIIEDVNTLHQQSLKEEREKVIEIIEESKKDWNRLKNKAKNDKSLIHQDKIYNHYKSIWIAHFDIIRIIQAKEENIKF